jgi:hypothetical protein
MRPGLQHNNNVDLRHSFAVRTCDVAGLAAALVARQLGSMIHMPSPDHSLDALSPNGVSPTTRRSAELLQAATQQHPELENLHPQ